MLTRISTASTYSNTISSYVNQESNLANVQQQISSGNKYSNFSDIAKDGQTRNIVEFASSLTQIDTYTKNNTLLSTRLTAMDTSLSGLEDINTKAIAAMTQKRSALSGDDPLAPQLKAMLQQVEDELNTNVSGRYLFSGAATNVPAVASLATTSNLSGLTPTANYYQGDAANLVQNVSKDVTIQYNVKADNPAFQKMIGAMNLAIKAEADKNDSELASAIDMANSAQNDLATVRSQIDSNATTVDQANAQHDNFKTYFTNTLGNISGTDTAEASIQLSLDQAVLTASFQAFARISSLSIGSYLSHA